MTYPNCLAQSGLNETDYCATLTSCSTLYFAVDKNTARVGTHELISIRLQFEAHHNYVEVQLCNADSSCGRVNVYGSAPSGALRYNVCHDGTEDGHPDRCSGGHEVLSRTEEFFSMGPSRKLCKFKNIEETNVI